MKEMTAQETQKKLKIVLLMVVGVPGQVGVNVLLDLIQQSVGAGNAMILNLLMKEMIAQETQKKLKIVLLMVVGVRGQAGVHVVQSEEAGIATILHHLMEEST